MNSDTMGRRLAEWEGEMRSRWEGIPDEDWTRALASGDRHEIVLLLERHYGWTRAQAEAELDRFVAQHAAAADDRSPSEAIAEDNAVRAQPGDVLGLDTEGETTGLGDTQEDEDKRRVDALRKARSAGRDS